MAFPSTTKQRVPLFPRGHVAAKKPCDQARYILSIDTQGDFVWLFPTLPLPRIFSRMWLCSAHNFCQSECLLLAFQKSTGLVAISGNETSLASWVPRRLFISREYSPLASLPTPWLSHSLPGLRRRQKRRLSGLAQNDPIGFVRPGPPTLANRGTSLRTHQPATP